MKRREFIQVMALGSVAATVPISGFSLSRNVMVPESRFWCHGSASAGCASPLAADNSHGSFENTVLSLKQRGYLDLDSFGRTD